MRWFAICAVAVMAGLGASGMGVAQAASATGTSAPSTAPSTTASTGSDARPIAVLGWLVGGVWTADASKLAPGMERIETRYQWSDNGSYVRFTTHFVTTKGAQKTYDGNFFWDPERKTLAMWYMDSRNAITQGPMSITGSQWQMTFHGEDFEGKQADFRVDIEVRGNDLYHWSLNEKTGMGGGS